MEILDLLAVAVAKAVRADMSTTLPQHVDHITSGGGHTDVVLSGQCIEVYTCNGDTPSDIFICYPAPEEMDCIARHVWKACKKEFGAAERMDMDKDFLIINIGGYGINFIR